MADRGRDIDEAAARFADTLAESYRIVYERAAEAQQRQERLAREFSERVMTHLKEQTESGRAVSEQLTDQAMRQQEAGQALAQESLGAYMDFLDTAFSRYREGTEQVTGSVQQGVRTLSDTTTGLLGTATGAVGATAGAAAGATAGGAPIEGYDEMNVRQIVERLDGLADSDLMAVRDYERRNKNRESLLAQIERRMQASS